MCDVFFMLELCILPSPVAMVLYQWPAASLQQLQCVINGATAAPHQAIDTLYHVKLDHTITTPDRPYN